MRLTITREPILLRPQCQGDICSIWNIGYTLIQTGVFGIFDEPFKILEHGGYDQHNSSFTRLVWLSSPDSDGEVVVVGFDKDPVELLTEGVQDWLAAAATQV